jgi:uncharacterized membrane protein YgcG
MHTPGRRLLAVSLLAGCLLVGAVPAAQKGAPARPVEDAANLFSAEARSRANAILADIKRDTRKELYVETFSTPPEAYRDKKPADFASQWAADLFRQRQVDGVFVLVCKQPALLRVRVGNVTREKGLFTSANAEELAKIMIDRLKASKDAKLTEQEQQVRRDEALLEGAAYVRRTLGRK